MSSFCQKSPVGRLASVKGIAQRIFFLIVILGVAPFALTQTQMLNVVLSPAVSITTPSSVSLTPAGTTFGSFVTSPLVVQFKIRNTASTGTGSITVQATEFSPLTGPRIANGNLTYNCGAASIGTSCSGTQTLSTTSTTAVVTSIPGSTCTGSGCPGTSPQSVQLSFKLANNPQYKTGTYSATLTFTISAT